MVTYIIKDWAELYETAETRKLKKLSWVPIPNKHDGKGFRRIIRRPDGLAILGAWMLILQVASREDQRGILEDQDGPLGFQEISDKTGGDPDVIAKAIEVLCSKEIGWLIERKSPGVPGDAPGIAGLSPGRIEGKGREQNRREENGIEADVLAQTLAANHPKTGDLTRVEHALAEILLRSDNRPATAVLIAERHGRWCHSWAHSGVQFAPKLSGWLQDGGWRQEPPERQKTAIEQAMELMEDTG